MRRALSGALFLALTAAGQSAEPISTHFPAIGGEIGRLEINASTDLSAMAPLILDFQQLEPGIAIDYNTFLTNDLAARAAEACVVAAAFGDLIISSAVDQMVKYANDGCAMSHVSDETRSIPNTSTSWRDEVFGFTFEPVVMVYNSNFIAPEDVPRSRNELAELLRRDQDYFSGKVATYDLRLSGLGYLLAFQDSLQNSTTYGRLLESLGRVEVQLSCCTSEILADIAQGRTYLGYNLLGSYALAAARQNPDLHIVLPRDYTLILHRAAAIPQNAPRADLGKLFLDYLLSDRGQDVALQQSFFFSRDGQVPDGVDGPSTLMTSGIGRTITIRPTLLAIQDEAQRRRFIDDWVTVIVPPQGQE